MAQARLTEEDHLQEFRLRLDIADFIDGYRDISFLRTDHVDHVSESVEQILRDAGIEDYVVHSDQVYLKDWQEPYLSELLGAIYEQRGEDRRISHPSLSSASFSSSTDINSKHNSTHSLKEDTSADSVQTPSGGLHVKDDTSSSNSRHDEGDLQTIPSTYKSTPDLVTKDSKSVVQQNKNAAQSSLLALRKGRVPKLAYHESMTSLHRTQMTSGFETGLRADATHGSFRTVGKSAARDSGRFNSLPPELGASEKHIDFCDDDEKPSDFMISEWMRQNGSQHEMQPMYGPSEVLTSGDHAQSAYLEQTTRPSTGTRMLDPRWWDRFQMMPREQVSSSATFLAVFKFFKVVCYIFLFIIVLSSAVVNKLCILLMTSSITKDPLPESQWPVKTMLVISMCFPYSMWFLVYMGKTVFGSHTWPSLSLLSSVLLFELLHTLGMSMLVFRVLPLLDMMRAFIVLGSIYVVPAFLKTIFEGRDPNMKMTRKCSLFMLNMGAFLIQTGSIVLCLMFQVTMTTEEKATIRNNAIVTDNVVVPRPPLTDGYFSGNLMFELPVSLLLISFAFWENYVEGDFIIFGKVITFKAWKKHLHHSRGRLYIFASVWKTVWVVVFAMLLQPGYNFNLSYSTNGAVMQNNNGPIAGNSAVAPSFSSTATSDINQENENINQSDTFKVIFRRQAETDDDGFDKTPDLHTTVTMATNLKTERTTMSGNKSKEPGKLFHLSAETMQHFEEYGVLYLQIISSTILTYFGSTACKMCMQLIGFSLPLTLATPISVTVVILQCVYKFLPTGRFVWVGVETGSNMWIFHLSWLGVLWLSEIFVLSHIWFPGNGRMEKIDRLFVTPIRCGILSDQSLMLRRRRNDQDASLIPDADDESVDPDADVYKADDVVPQIYACATMWHETRAEMTNLLKSIFRMDIDHSGRYLAQKFFKIRDPDYYEFEGHIFIDDAMELSDDDQLVPNMFVADLMECIDDSLSSVHERQMSLGPPTRTPTPYGGRLTWRLPGGTKLIAHLKDKHKVRHKKRWSQVMYMYYLLGYRILAQPENLLTKDMMEGNADGEFQRVKLTDSQLRKRRKAAHFTRSVIFNYVTDEVHNQAENTYILTLDGDVDFHPDAVRLLIDRLKTNKKVGASCGRIHPIGSGPLLWYQQFEYAIGHWLQKASEDVFGCVMCAPGCFSLFRGSALMDDNVARTYATRATEAGHYVQYDQGEDRWLSTLLLQQGYRIDYCAAADALTHAPETFSEFFNQRRRWGPSTLANIVDLLGSWKATIAINDNVSTLYILYQFCLMISTILGPATILLMLAGAFTVVFKTTVVQSYLLALLPAIFFIIVCIYTRTKTQMTVASIMSAVYAILMTIVLVGTVGQAIEGGITSPNVVFLVMLVFIFFVSALMHPEEFFCVIPGALYFICLPTGYLLLTIYYLCNMNVVSWGTREVPTRKSKEQIEEEKRIAEERRRKKEEKKKGILGWMGLNGFFREMGEMLKQVRSDVSGQGKSKTDVLLEELILEVRSNRQQTQRPRSRSSGTMTDAAFQAAGSNQDSKANETQPHVESLLSTTTEEPQVPVWLQREEQENPGWLQSSVCGDGQIKRLPDKEDLFWKQIIAKYLHPINEDKLHQEKVKDDLVNLRNNVVFGFFMTSALWIALAMQLQVLQDELKGTLFFKIPRWDMTDDLAIEPLGLIFLAFFAAILSVQFLGMFAHRWGTVLHMLSITELSCGKTFTEKDKVRDIISKAMELQKLSNIENEPIPDYDEPLADYEYSDEENDVDTMSVVDTISLWSVNPPSYHSGQPNAGLPPNRRYRQDIFNRRGHSSGVALRKAFEKRFRNEHHQIEGRWDTTGFKPDAGDRNVALYDICENEAASPV